jgi:hypothetical protein
MSLFVSYTYGGFDFDWDGEVIMIRNSETRTSHSLLFYEAEEEPDIKAWRKTCRDWARVTNDR